MQNARATDRSVLSSTSRDRPETADAMDRLLYGVRRYGPLHITVTDTYRDYVTIRYRSP